MTHQNKHRYFIKYLTIFTLLIGIVLLKTSCKKNDAFVSEAEATKVTTTNQFFNLPSNVNSAVARVANALAKQNAQTGFVKELTTTAGYPVWDKSILELSNQANNANSLFEDHKGGDTCILVPMVLQDAQYVNAFISAVLIGDSVTMRMYYRNDYKAYPFKASQPSATVTSAEDFAGRMMAFDKEVFGYTDFEIKDKRLFNGSTNYSDTGKITRIVKLTNTITPSGSNNLIPACIEFTFEVNTYNCGTPNYCNANGGCDRCSSYCSQTSMVTVTVCGSSQGGGSGGGTSTPGWPSAPPSGPGGTGGGGSPTGGGPTGCLVGGLIQNGFAPPNPCNPPTGGNPLPPINPNLIWLRNNLPLTPNQFNWLLEKPFRFNEVYNYLEEELTNERIQLAKSHVERMRVDVVYSQYVDSHGVIANPNKMWWEDAPFLLRYGGLSFGTWAITYLKENPTVQFSKFKNQFLGKVEGKDGDDNAYDSTYWENPTLDFPQQNLPSWANYYNAYPHASDSSGLSADSVYKLVGGAIYQKHISPDSNIRKNYQNACALRVSRALLYSGINIPEVPGTMKGGDGKNYFLAARALNAWMRKTFKTYPTNPNHHHFTKAQGGVNGRNFPTLLAPYKGIYSLVSPKGSTWATGHADCWLPNGKCVNNCHFADADIEYVDMWELN
jgi:hypothetical protein